MGGATKNCPASANDQDVMCVVEAYGFPGGDVAVDADVLADDQAPRQWRLDNLKEGGRCVGDFVAADPPRSWVCHGLPAGTLTLMVPKAPWNSASAVIRWG